VEEKELSFYSFRRLIYFRLPTKQYALLAVSHHRTSKRSPGYSLLLILRLSPPLQQDSGDWIFEREVCNLDREFEGPVLTGNSAGLKTVLSSRLSHRELRSSLRESHTHSVQFFLKSLTAQFNLRVYGGPLDCMGPFRVYGAF